MSYVLYTTGQYSVRARLRLPAPDLSSTPPQASFVNRIFTSNEPFTTLLRTLYSKAPTKFHISTASKAIGLPRAQISTRPLPCTVDATHHQRFQPTLSFTHNLLYKHSRTTRPTQESQPPGTLQPSSVKQASCHTVISQRNCLPASLRGGGGEKPHEKNYA